MYMNFRNEGNSYKKDFLKDLCALTQLNSREDLMEAWASILQRDGMNAETKERTIEGYINRIPFAYESKEYLLLNYYALRQNRTVSLRWDDDIFACKEVNQICFNEKEVVCHVYDVSPQRKKLFDFYCRAHCIDGQLVKVDHRTQLIMHGNYLINMMQYVGIAFQDDFMAALYKAIGNSNEETSDLDIIWSAIEKIALSAEYENEKN